MDDNQIAYAVGLTLGSVFFAGLVLNAMAF
jgi:hypothetical protein